MAQLWTPPSAKTAQHKKASPPKMGEKFGQWAGQDQIPVSLPGGAMLQFDLDKLTLSDYKMMRHHYQINASLSVLSFMIHQIDWHIECEDQRIADECEEQLRNIWTRLIRGVSNSFWAGYSPMVLQYENDIDNRRIMIDKVKDLRPEECRVNWREVEGYAPPKHVKPKLKVYDGIRQFASSWPIPVENSLWYPLLMENGDYYGKKLLKPAFPSWFFSMLIHLFANRYFERFGEPLPIGRADFEADVQIGTEMMSGREAMEQILLNLRNRSVVTLPSDRDPTTKEYMFDLEYLESQMRGADFERYLTRLDEEMSLSMFTPLLLLRVADVGSYNLGVGHMQIYLWMLNALAGDIKEYIDRYVLERIKAINFSPKAPKVKWVPLKMGKQNVETIRAVITELTRIGAINVDLQELGQAVGLTIEEAEILSDPNDPVDDDNRQGRPNRSSGDGPRGVGETRSTAKDIQARISGQVARAYKKGNFDSGFSPKLGYRTKFEEDLVKLGWVRSDAHAETEKMFARIQSWLDEAVELGSDAYSGPDELSSMFGRVLDHEVERLLDVK